VTAFSVLLDLALKRQKSGEPPVSDLLCRLQGQAKRLSRLIIDLLDVSRLDRGMITLREICADIVSVISATVDEFIMQFPKRRFQFHRPPRAIEIDLDPARISQVLSNLLDNAVKYTPEDIPVEIHIDSRTDWVRVSVVDHGPGIAKDQQANLFSPFTRGTTDREERAGGLGLGLAVCRGLIELHGGTMGVMSEPGVGSTFYFELPRVICSRKDK
jgi:signal transduction histidine kinase